MESTFRSEILAEIEEVAEFAIVNLIPCYIQTEKNKEIKSDFLENLTLKDFEIMRNQVVEIIESENLAICRYQDTHSVERKDYFLPLKEEEQKTFLNDISNWIYEKGKPAYFLCRKE